MDVKLADLQNLIYRLITSPDGIEPNVAGEPLLKGSGLAALIAAGGNLSALERLTIYANAYFYRLHDILTEDYPCVYATLGCAYFHCLVTRYLVEYPPRRAVSSPAGQQTPRLCAVPRVPSGSSAGAVAFSSRSRAA
jgi:hypothetical protein